MAIGHHAPERTNSQSRAIAMPITERDQSINSLITLSGERSHHLGATKPMGKITERKQHASL